LNLAIDGYIPKPDVIMFGDTHSEPREVYDAIEDDKKLAAAEGIPFFVVTAGDLKTPPNNQIRTPLFTLTHENGKAKRGQLLRTCTDVHKIKPIRRKLRELGAGSATVWIGISTDEIERMKPSPVKWVTHDWPLIDLRMSRKACLEYLEEKGIHATRSACVFCPFKGSSEWARLSGADLEQAIAYDESIRDKRPGFKCFVHRARVPLREALGLPADSTIMDACDGNCWN
jgi:hypothetical protein